MDFKEVIKNLKNKFTSGNEIPVERSIINRKEWDVIYDVLEKNIKHENEEKKYAIVLSGMGEINISLVSKSFIDWVENGGKYPKHLEDYIVDSQTYDKKDEKRIRRRIQDDLEGLSSEYAKSNDRASYIPIDYMSILSFLIDLRDGRINIDYSRLYEGILY